MIESLSDLLHPHDPRQLLAAFSAHERLLLRTGRADAFRRLLPWDQVNALVTAETIEAGIVELSRSSVILPLEMSVQRLRDENHRPSLKLTALQENCRRGLSIVINNIQQSVRGIALMNAIVEREFRAPVHTNAYVSFGRNSAFKAHWDNQNVLNLQTHGRKLWRGWANLFLLPVDKAESKVPADPGPPDWEAVLEPGDVLYLPRGHVHQAEVIDGEDAVHMTVTIVPPRGGQLAQSLAMVCERDPDGRRDLPLLASAEAKAAWLSRMKVLLHQAVDALDLDQILADLDRAREPLSFTSLGHLGRVTEATRFQPALRRRPPPDRQGESGAVRAGSRTWQLGATESAILDHATRCHTARAGDLPALMPETPWDEIRVAISDMAGKGLLILLEPE